MRQIVAVSPSVVTKVKMWFKIGKWQQTHNKTPSFG